MGTGLGRLKRYALYSTALIIIFVACIWLCQRKTIDDVRRDFLRNQRQYDELAQSFERVSKLASITWETDSLITIVVWRDSFPRPALLEVQPNDESVARLLRGEGIAQDDFGQILTLLKKLSDPRSGIGFEDTITRDEDDTVKSVKKGRAVEIFSPHVYGCSWVFMTPRKPYTLEGIAQSINARPGRGPYILNERWLVYVRCGTPWN